MCVPRVIKISHVLLGENVMQVQRYSSNQQTFCAHKTIKKRRRKEIVITHFTFIADKIFFLKNKKLPMIVNVLNPANGPQYALFRSA